MVSWYYFSLRSHLTLWRRTSFVPEFTVWCGFFLHPSHVLEASELKGVVLNCRLLFWALFYHSSLSCTAPSTLVTSETAFALAFCLLCSCSFRTCCFCIVLPLAVSSLPTFIASDVSLLLHWYRLGLRLQCTDQYWTHRLFSITADTNSHWCRSVIYSHVCK